MSAAPNAAPPPLQIESHTLYHNDELGGTNTTVQFAHHASPSICSAQVTPNFGTTDPLDIQQPLPETWCSVPQASLHPEVPRPDGGFSSNSAMGGNYGTVPPDGGPSSGRSLVPSEPYSLDPLVPSAQDEVRTFPCLFIQHRSGNIMAVPGPGHLEFVYSNAQLERWIDFARARGALPQVARSANRGEDPQIKHDAAPAVPPVISGWHEGMSSLPQSTYAGPQTPMSATPMSVQVHPSSQFNQHPVPRASYSGPSDLQCAPAATSIPIAPHYYDVPASLNHPPPPISYTANLDPRRSAVHPHAFYQSSAPMDNRVPICFESLAHLPADNRTPPLGVPQLISPTQDTGTAPEYPVHRDLPPEARAHRQTGGPGRTREPHGRGRSG